MIAGVRMVSLNDFWGGGWQWLRQTQKQYIDGHSAGCVWLNQKQYTIKAMTHRIGLHLML